MTSLVQLLAYVQTYFGQSYTSLVQVRDLFRALGMNNSINDLSAIIVQAVEFTSYQPPDYGGGGD